MSTINGAAQGALLADPAREALRQLQEPGSSSGDNASGVGNAGGNTRVNAGQEHDQLRGRTRGDELREQVTSRSQLAEPEAHSSKSPLGQTLLLDLNAPPPPPPQNLPYYLDAPPPPPPENLPDRIELPRLDDLFPHWNSQPPRLEDLIPEPPSPPDFWPNFPEPIVPLPVTPLKIDPDKLEELARKYTDARDAPDWVNHLERS